MIKHVFIDFDGTLADTKLANIDAYSAAFAKFGLPFSAKEYKKCFGLRFDDLCEHFNVPQELRQQLKDQKKMEYAKRKWEVELNESLVGLIRYWKRQGVTTTIVSTASKANLEGILEYFDIVNLFDNVICGESVKRGKPNPDAYFEALKLYKYPNPREVLVFEDSETGIKAAEAAGITNIIKIGFYE